MGVWGDERVEFSGKEQVTLYVCVCVYVSDVQTTCRTHIQED